MHLLPAIPPIDFSQALNEDQYRAVTAGNGPALVLAGAGSGKTRTLTYRVAYLLEQGVRPWEILLLTFTNKAAREMLERVEDLTGVVRSQFWGGTFHSIGQRIIRTHAALAGIDRNFTILDSGDADSLFNEVVKSKDAAFLKNKNNPKPRLILDAVSYARNTRRPVEEVFEAKFAWLEDESLAKLPDFAEAYRKHKRETGVCDYDDLLEIWLELLEKNPEVREQYRRKFRYILVDEFQDTNKLQSAIVDAIAGDHQIMAVGDDAQCIYTWRGAEFANIADFETRHPGAAIHKIEINYRSSPQILDFANGILSNQLDNAGYSKTLRPVRDAGPKPYVVPTMDANEQALFVIKRIERLHYEGRKLSEITVLYRAHFQAMELQMELTRQGIPFVITSGLRFFEQAHVKDLVAQLRFVHNPGDAIAFTRLTALLPKVGPKTAERILDTAKKEARARNVSILTALGADGVKAKVPEVARDDFTDLILTMQDMEEGMHGPKRQAPATLKNADAGKDAGGPAHPDLFEHAAGNAAEPLPPPETHIVKTPGEILQIAIDGWYGDFIKTVYENYRDRTEDLKSLVTFANKFTDINELLAQLVLLNSETGDKSAEMPADTLRLTTIHQAKGLEFPIVFVIGCADELLPLKRAIEEGDVDEERRLFYVASTRAMEELYCVYPKITVSGGPPRLLNPSRFISELPANTYEMLHISRLRG